MKTFEDAIKMLKIYSTWANSDSMGVMKRFICNLFDVDRGTVELMLYKAKLE